ncbi:MAG: NAD(P)-binding domain-containing protein [Anaerolineales bacterium]|nr:NAD(P)-binding domain-containing protein [Anaerolineales bacterium]
MKITVLGAGNIGATLGKKWAAQGHDVIFGVRDVTAAKYQTLLETMTGQAAVAPTVEAAAAAEVIVLAIPGAAVNETLAQLGSTLADKIIIDATNQISQADMSAVATIAAAAPQAKLFRAFNTLGWENFETPELDSVQIDLFYCGESSAGQETVDQLIADIGLRPVYLGGLDKAPVLDALTRLWFTLAYEQGNGRRLAFKMLRA